MLLSNHCETQSFVLSSVFLSFPVLSSDIAKKEGFRLHANCEKLGRNDPYSCWHINTTPHAAKLKSLSCLNKGKYHYCHYYTPTITFERFNYSLLWRIHSFYLQTASIRCNTIISEADLLTNILILSLA